jgi:(p)ppGpp synthase/HD superfamily hydrolase
MTQLYSNRVGQALALAADAFAGVIRKGTDGDGQPPIIYLSHLLQVAAWVAEHRGTEDQIIAAVLHDYLEDIDGSTEQELAARFGDRVASYVAALSDATERPKPPWKERKLAYLAKLEHKPAEVKLISACDKLHNASRILHDLRDVGDQVFDRFTASKDDTLWYYRQVVDALATGWQHPALDELGEVVARLLEAAGVRASLS